MPKPSVFFLKLNTALKGQVYLYNKSKIKICYQ